MLQRIQSVWLLLAATCAFISMKISFYSGVIKNPELVFIEVNGMYNIPNAILTISIAVITLINIFLFKNRKLQMRFILLCIFLELLLMFNYEFILKSLDKGNYSIGSFLQLLLMISLIFALRGIRKDNKMIAESDRLR